MPLSNPTSRAEATPSDLFRWTDGRAIVATGSPFDDVVHDGVAHRISQSNNVYVFPGLGLGAVAVGASGINDRMLMTAASTVAQACTDRPVAEGILPALDEVSALSSQIASAVARVAIEDGLAEEASEREIAQKISDYRWSPAYPEINAV